MTIKQLKQTMRAVRENRVEIRELTDKREEIRARAEKVTQTLTGMPGTHDAGDKIGNYVSEMSELTGMLDKRIHDLTAQECQVIQWISKLEDGLHRSVLLIYYVTGPIGCTWDYVAKQISYSTDWVLRAHGRALQDLLAAINDKDKVNMKNHKKP